MATFDIAPFFRPPLLGSARTPLHTSLSSDGSGFPAYNVLRLGEEEFRISVAVPGYDAAEITVEAWGGSVRVTGTREVDADHNRYLYRGIDLQNFQRTFQLPEHVEVKEARLEAGILHIDLRRELPEALRPRRIDIHSGDDSPPALETQSKAA